MRRQPHDPQPPVDPVFKWGSLLMFIIAAIWLVLSLPGCAAPPIFVGKPAVWWDGGVYTISQRVDWCQSATKPPTPTCHSGLALPATATPETP